MLTPYDLRCEYAVNPLGIDTTAPRFGWKLVHPERRQRQTAYQIIAAPTVEQLNDMLRGRLSAPLHPHTGDLAPAPTWDSGKVSSPNSVAVDYDGPPLDSRMRVYWCVRAWDTHDQPGPWSAPAWFETALLRAEDWRAVWVGYPAAWPGRDLYFRKQFQVSQPIMRGRLYACGLGYHELYINGQRLGEAVLDPAYTDISQRVMYRTFDVTSLLNGGANVIAARVGNGWHGFPRLLAQLELIYADGRMETHTTDPAAQWSVAPGPIIEHSVYGGETYDARAERPGWNQPMTAGLRGWVSAMRVPEPGGRLVAQTLEPIRVMREIAPQAITTPAPGIYVVDLGQNIAGWVQLRVAGARGARIVLRFAEMLYADGTVNQENLREIPPTDTYILSGEGEEVWEPAFTYHGFRYVQIEGYPSVLTPDRIVGKLVRSAVPDGGSFTCSSDLLNHIQTLVRWTEEDNLHGIPTDCPQRNERMGWLNDMSARAEEVILNFDMARLLAKWIGDIYDAQDLRTGAIPGTAPWAWAPRPTDPVCVSYLETAWLLYAHYGDRRLLKTYYPGFCKWLECLTGLAHDHIIQYSPWGDWAPPLEHTVPGTARSRLTPGDLMSTGYYFYTAHLLARIAGILGYAEERIRHETLAAQIGEAFNARYWHEEIGGYGTGSQTCNAFALWLGLAPLTQRARIMANLVRDVAETHGGHLTTGNVGAKYLLEALADHGRPEAAVALAMQTTYPSWGFMLANGATTLWERWELCTGYGMNSHNHPMLGSVSSWFYKALAGIHISAESFGFDRFTLRPYFAPELAFVSATHATVRGPLRSAWRCTEAGITWTIEIPVNSEADVIIPTMGRAIRIDEEGVCIWDGQAPGAASPGLTFQSHGADAVVFRAGSGIYELCLRNC